MSPSGENWRLGEILVQKGWITWEQLETALALQQQTKKKVDTLLLENGFLTSKETQSLCLGEILIKHGWLTWDNLERGLVIQRQSGSMLGEVLVKNGFITRVNLYHALALQWGKPFVDFNKVTVPPLAIQAIPKHLAQEYGIMPLLKKDGIFLIAISDPQDVRPEMELKKIIPDYEIRSVIAAPEDIQKAFTRYYGES